MLMTQGKYLLKRFFAQEAEAVTVVEIILILVVLIALVVIFKTQMTSLVEAIFESINKKAGTIY